MYKIHLDKRHISDLESGARWLCISAIQLALVSYQIPENMQEVKFVSVFIISPNYTWYISLCQNKNLVLKSLKKKYIEL